MILKYWRPATMLLVLFLLANFAYVRLTPVPVDGMHLRSPLSGLGHLNKSNGHIWRGAQKDDGVAQLTTLEDRILATPRTERLKGSVAGGIVTYVTYSRWWRFPDITTVERSMSPPPMGVPMIAVNARALYGISDLGVNRRRVTDWLSVLKR